MARISHEKQLHERLLAKLGGVESAEDKEIREFIEDLGDMDVDLGDMDDTEDFSSSGPSDEDDDDQIEDLPIIREQPMQEVSSSQEDPDANTLRASFGSLRLSNVFPENSMSFRASMSLCSSFLSSATSLMRQSLLSIDSGLRSSIDSRRSDATIHPASSGDCSEESKTCQQQIKIENIGNLQTAHEKPNTPHLQYIDPNPVSNSAQIPEDGPFELRASIATYPESNFTNRNRNLGGSFYSAGASTFNPPQPTKQNSEPFLMRSSLNTPTYHLQHIQETYTQQPQAEFNRSDLIDRSTFDSSSSSLLRASVATNATAPAKLGRTMFVGTLHDNTSSSVYLSQDYES